MHAISSFVRQNVSLPIAGEHSLVSNVLLNVHLNMDIYILRTAYTLNLYRALSMPLIKK